MNIFTLVMNASTIIGAITTIEGIIQKCVVNKRLPDAADDAALIGAAEALLLSGVIAIPGVDMGNIGKVLEEIKQRLPVAVTKAA